MLVKHGHWPSLMVLLPARAEASDGVTRSTGRRGTLVLSASLPSEASGLSVRSPGHISRWPRSVGGVLWSGLQPPTARGRRYKGMSAPQRHMFRKLISLTDGLTSPSISGSSDLSPHRWAISAIGGGI